MFWLIIFLLFIVILSNNVLRFYFKLTLFYLILALTPMLCIPLALFRPKDARNNIYPCWIAYIVTKMYNIEWQVENGETLLELDSAVIVSNHQSVLDSMGLMSVYPFAHPMIPVMKEELLYTGPFGIFAYLSGCLFIDRLKSDEAKQKMNEKVIAVKNKKWKLWIYPEGTRNPEGQLLPFKKGAFHVAIHAQIPMVPVVYEPFNNVYNFRKKIFNSGKLRVHVLKPISTIGLTASDASSLCERVRTEMSNLLDSYNNSKLNELKEIELKNFKSKICISGEDLTQNSRKL